MLSKSKTIYTFIFSLGIIFLFSIPSFVRMLHPGIFSTQDFHFFRLVEFDRCMVDLQVPCRWSSFAGLGYGEPLFNFYSQLSYVPSELVHIFGFSFIDSIKFGFIFSLVGSAVAMFLLVHFFTRNWYASIAAAMIYTYAPYRAVDVWVRGALPEAMSFVLFPLCFLAFEHFVKRRTLRSLLYVSCVIALIINTHNLSVILFGFGFTLWIIFRSLELRSFAFIKGMFIAGFVALLVSAFYIFPVIVESQFVNLYSTTTGYFDFRGHFVSLNQLLFSRFWGYGGSIFGTEDGMNLSIGHIQWITPLVLILTLFVVKKGEIFLKEGILICIGWAYLGLVHYKSIGIWLSIDAMKFIQFPWRFLGPALFVFSLSIGLLIAHFPQRQQKILMSVLLVAVIMLNSNFFKEDVWYEVSDAHLISGIAWEDQTRASISDYWPTFFSSIIPTEYAPIAPAGAKVIQRRSNSITYEFPISFQGGIVEFPVNYFPGWTVYEKTEKQEVYPATSGRIAAKLDAGQNYITLKFENTLIRLFSDLLSYSTLVAVLFFMLFGSKKYEI